MQAHRPNRGSENAKISDGPITPFLLSYRRQVIEVRKKPSIIRQQHRRKPPSTLRTTIILLNQICDLNLSDWHSPSGHALGSRANEQRFSRPAMTFPRNSLRAFLSHAKTHLHTALKRRQCITFVVGNQSAGSDSQPPGEDVPPLTNHPRPRLLDFIDPVCLHQVAAATAECLQPTLHPGA